MTRLPDYPITQLLDYQIQYLATIPKYIPRTSKFP
jgi:hypothetical protein